MYVLYTTHTIYINTINKRKTVEYCSIGMGVLIVDRDGGTDTTLNGD